MINQEWKWDWELWEMCRWPEEDFTFIFQSLIIINAGSLTCEFMRDNFTTYFCHQNDSTSLMAFTHGYILSWEIIEKEMFLHSLVCTYMNVSV